MGQCYCTLPWDLHPKPDFQDPRPKSPYKLALTSPSAPVFTVPRESCPCSLTRSHPRKYCSLCVERPFPLRRISGLPSECQLRHFLFLCEITSTSHMKRAILLSQGPERIPWPYLWRRTAIPDCVPQGRAVPNTARTAWDCGWMRTASGKVIHAWKQNSIVS